MKIALILYGSLDLLTGGWIYDRRLVQYLCEQGHSVDVISLRQRKYVCNLIDNFSGPLQRRWRDDRCKLILEDALSHPSLIRFNHRIRQTRGLPIVTIVHQVLCRQPFRKIRQLFYRAFERRYFQSVNGYIFNSETTRRNVVDLLNHQYPSIVAYPGGDRLGYLAAPETIESKCRRPGPIRLIVVGNLTPNKGILPLITALSGLPQEDWHLTIVGSLTMDRRYARKVAALVDRLGLSARVDIHGPLDGRDLVECLTRSHLFVLPFSYEGFGMACLEAMGWGLPVIGSAAGAPGEFVEDGVSGVLIAPGDVNAFAEHIHHLHTHRDLLADCSRAALKMFRRRPGWQDSLQKIHSFLLSMAGHPKSDIYG